MTRLAWIILPLVCVMAGCGSKPSPVGDWKNRDGNLLTLTEGASAYLGQEGYDTRDTGTYVREGETITIRTRPIEQNGQSFYNVYILRQDGDSLALRSITLVRGSDTMRTTAEELARRMGRSPSAMVFHRQQSGSGS